jgi:DNA-directed RNA polymerase subunit RPC12/RpoP
MMRGTKEDGMAEAAARCSQKRLPDDYGDPTAPCPDCGSELRVVMYPRQGVKRPFIPLHTTAAPATTAPAKAPAKKTRKTRKTR